MPHGLLAARHGREIIERVRGGEIGRLELVEIESNRWDIINASIHWLNFFVALTDNEPCESVIAACDRSTRAYRDGMQVETLAVKYAITRSGVRVVMQTGDDVRIMRAGAECQFRIIGDAGTIEFYGWESAYRLANARHPNGERFEPPRNARTGTSSTSSSWPNRSIVPRPTMGWPKARSRRWNCARRPILRPSAAA